MTRFRLLCLVACSGLALAGCSSYGSCGECSSPAIDATATDVWVAQGRTLSRLDPGQGWRTETVVVFPPTPDGRFLTGVAATPSGVFVAWRKGVAVIHQGRVVHHMLPTQLLRPTLIRQGDRAWVFGGRRLVALNADGSIGPIRVFDSGARAERAMANLTPGRLPRGFGTTTVTANGTYRSVRRDDATVWVERLDEGTGAVLWRSEIPTT